MLPPVNLPAPEPVVRPVSTRPVPVIDQMERGIGGIKGVFARAAQESELHAQELADETGMALNDARVVVSQERQRELAQQPAAQESIQRPVPTPRPVPMPVGIDALLGGGRGEPANIPMPSPPPPVVNLPPPVPPVVSPPIVAEPLPLPVPLPPPPPPSGSRQPME